MQPMNTSFSIVGVNVIINPGTEYHVKLDGALSDARIVTEDVDATIVSMGEDWNVYHVPSLGCDIYVNPAKDL